MDKQSLVLVSLWITQLFAGAFSRKGNECSQPPAKIDKGLLYRSIDNRFVEYRCFPGYVAAGPTYARCEDGQWTSSPPQCLGRNCRRLELISHGTTVLSNRGAVVRFKCQTGYRLKGSEVLACLGEKWNGTKPECIETNPKSKKKTQYLAASRSVSTSWIAKADYSCISGSSRISPPVVENGHSTVKWALVGGKPRLYARFICKYGYETKGRAKMYCKEGRWVGSRPYCKGYDEPDDYRPSKTSNTGRYYGDQPDPGSLSHREWMREADYTCTGETPPEVEDGHRWTRYAMVEGHPRLYAMYECRWGYKMEGDQYMYCKNGEWVGNPGRKPMCSQKDSVHDPDDPCEIDNGDCEQLCDVHRGKAQCSCTKGYRLQKNERNCKDVDECDVENGGCDHKCFNLDGSFECGCHPGYRLAKDQKRCLKETPGTKVPPNALFFKI